MAMLKTIGQGHRAKGAYRANLSDADRRPSGHTGSTRDIDDYLHLGPKAERDGARNVERYLDEGHGRPGREMAFGHTPELAFGGSHGWSAEMDGTRRRFGKDWGRTYYHFVISADPKDHVGAEELRDVALEWVEGALPGTQAIVSVHDDNANRVMHAHVVVNSVYPDSGRKIHISDRQADRMADLCQDICLEHGLGALPRLSELKRGRRSLRDAQATRQWSRDADERRLSSRGVRSWKAEIRQAVDACAATSRTWREFELNMGKMGYRVRGGRRGGGSVTFYHPDSTGHDRRVRGSVLGEGYTVRGIESRLSTDLEGLLSQEPTPSAPWAAWDAKARPMPAWAARRARENAHALRASSRRAAGRRGLVTLEDLAMAAHGSEPQRVLDAVVTMRREGYRDAGDVRAGIADARGRLERAEEALRGLERATRQVSGAVEAMREAKGIEVELARLPGGIWSRATRERRNALRVRLAELAGEVAPMVEQAKAWLGETGARMDDEDRLVAVASGLRDRARRERASADAVAYELERIQDAERVLCPRRTRVDKDVPGAGPVRLVTYAGLRDGHSLVTREELARRAGAGIERDGRIVEAARARRERMRDRVTMAMDAKAKSSDRGGAQEIVSAERVRTNARAAVRRRDVAGEGTRETRRRQS